MINTANISLFMSAAVGRAKELKRSRNDHTHNVGVVIAHSAGVISVAVQTAPVDPNDLSEIFAVGGVDRSYEDCIDDAAQEIRIICATMGMTIRQDGQSAQFADNRVPDGADIAMEGIDIAIDVLASRRQAPAAGDDGFKSGGGGDFGGGGASGDDIGPPLPAAPASDAVQETGFLDSVLKTGSDLLDDAARAISGASDSVTSTASEAFDKAASLGEVAANAGNTVAGLGSEAAEAAVKLGGAVVEGAGEAIGGVLGALGDLSCTADISAERMAKPARGTRRYDRMAP